MGRMWHNLSKIDYWFLVSFMLLVLLGAGILQTASISDPQEIIQGGGMYDDFFQQLYKGILPGLFFFFIVQFIPYRVWRKYSIGLYVLVVLINLAVIVPALGITELGATRWIEIGGFSFQPSEPLKLVLILYLSMLLAQHKQTINSPGSVVLFLLVILIPFVIVGGLQSNLSTAFLLAMIGGALLFISRLHLAWIGGLIGIGIVLGGGFIALESYRMERVTTFVRFLTQNQAELCQENQRGNVYHRCQNLIAVGSGGVTGVGIGQGVQKFNYVPKATNDSIFAVYAEETGFVGVSLFLGIILWIIYRALVIAGAHRSDDFARLVILGIVAWFILQIFINIGSTIGILPITGVTLPFVSQGNTSLWVLFVAFGIIASISKTDHSRSNPSKK